MGRLAVAPDGTVWASWEEDGEWVVGHLGPSGWQPLDGYARSASSYFDGFDRLYLTDPGDLYGFEDDGYTNALYRYEDGAWDQVSDAYELIDVGPDGTVWQDGGVGSYPGPEPASGLFPAPGTVPGDGLARLASGTWTVWEPADLPDIGFGLGLDYQFEVAPDGSLWSSLWRSADDSHPVLAGRWEEQMAAVVEGRLVCDGLARFDGVTWSRFLPGRCISMDIAPDGAVWVVASDLSFRHGRVGFETYVITPEAVAATE